MKPLALFGLPFGRLQPGDCRIDPCEGDQGYRAAFEAEDSNRAGISQLRFSLLIALFGATFLTACGTGGSDNATQQRTGSADATSSPEPGRSLTRTEPAGKGKWPWTRPRSGPRPKVVVIKDLKGGSGAVAKVGDELWVHYGAFDYATGKSIETSWILTYKFELGSGFANEGWERGLVGMRAGGRRELSVPAKFAPANVAEVFVVDLVAVK